jgi:hypothetical protein
MEEYFGQIMTLTPNTTLGQKDFAVIPRELIRRL